MDQLTSVHIAAWLACAAFVVGLALGIISLVDRLKAKPSPQEVADSAQAKFARREESDELKCRLAAMEQLRQSDLRDASLSRKNIYDEMRGMEKRIDASLVGVRTEMGELERRLNKSDEERTAKLHESLNCIATELAEIRGEFHAANKPNANRS